MREYEYTIEDDRTRCSDEAELSLLSKRQHLEFSKVTIRYSGQRPTKGKENINVGFDAAAVISL